MSLPSRPQRRHCSIARLDPLDGQRVFGADVEEAVLGADGEAADDHPLDHVQRIGLQHAAVHEGAGIAFVGVADEVAGLFLGGGGHRPFLPGGKAAAAPAAELRPRDLLDHPLRIAPLQHLGQRLEAAVVEILFDALGVDARRCAAGRRGSGG